MKKTIKYCQDCCWNGNCNFQRTKTVRHCTAKYKNSLLKKEPDFIILPYEYYMRKELEKDVLSNYLPNGRPFWR